MHLWILVTHFKRQRLQHVPLILQLVNLANVGDTWNLWEQLALFNDSQDHKISWNHSWVLGACPCSLPRTCRNQDLNCHCLFETFRGQLRSQLRLRLRPLGTCSSLNFEPLKLNLVYTWVRSPDPIPPNVQSPQWTVVPLPCTIPYTTYDSGPRFDSPPRMVSPPKGLASAPTKLLIQDRPSMTTGEVGRGGPCRPGSYTTLHYFSLHASRSTTQL